MKKLNRIIESINSYYAFSLLLYSAILFVLSYTEIFLWVFLIITPALAAWGGYLLRTYLQQRNQRYGFELISDNMTYEIKQNHKYTLRYYTVAKAASNHLMTYPISYQWTGSGEEGVPKITGKGQALLTQTQSMRKGRPYRALPYKTHASSTGEWHFWFISLNPPLHKDDVVEIQYSQDFVDTKKTARPYLRYFVSAPMQQLELHVKFPSSSLPNTITGGYYKPYDSARLRSKSGVRYDKDKQWASWIIEKPKRGYCYQINWQ